MEKSILMVDGMACEHCVNAITKAVTALAGVENVDVDLAGKTVTVFYTAGETSIDKIKQEIENQGYDVVG